MREYDLHLHRFDEAKTAALGFVDRLYYDGEPCGRLIHGQGIIADHLPDWLAEYPFVIRIERDVVNGGSTVVWLAYRDA